VSKKKPFWLVSVVAPLVLLIAILGGFGALSNWHPDFLEPSQRALFRRTSDGWRSLPPLPGRVESVRISASGVVWALTWTHDAGDVFARLDCERWQTYRVKDIDRKGYHSVANNDFALDGEQLWAAGGDEVFHWDGRRWEIFHDQPAEAIVAMGGEAWALDDVAHLAHFANGRWTPVNAEPPKDNPEDGRELVRTGDGSLWLPWNLLWRLDRGKWREVDTGFEDVDLVGATEDRVWMWEEHQLRSISVYDEEQTVYGPERTTLGR
jgi:hypothetical protein